MSSDKPNEFEQNNSQQQTSLPAEFLQFLKERKKYWLIPVILALLAVGALIILGGTAAAPFIYTLF
jgi:hypothetical protein